MSLYPRVQLGEIATIRGGKRLPKGEEFSPTRTDHPYIRARDIKNGRVTFAEPVYLTSELATRLDRYSVEEGDVCITIVGANVGDVGAVPAFLHGANLTENAVKVVASEAVDRMFLKFALLTDHAQDQMKLLAGGAAQPKLGIYKVETVELSVPGRTTQRKIAAVLSAYDDLIENNLRRIEILEEMAQVLYREWFVKFRFPGHEEVRMVDSPVGEIPDGWRTVPLSEVADVNGKTVNKRTAPENINYVDIASVSPGRINGMDAIRFDDAPSRARRIGCHGDTIWSTVRPNRRSHALIIDPPSNLIVSTGFAVLSPIDVPFTFFYYSVTTDDFADYLTNHATGSAYPAVSARDFEKAELVLPLPSVMDAFHETIEPMTLAIQSFLNQNSVLRDTRDLLLPRLICGELDVSELDIAVPEEAA